MKERSLWVENVTASEEVSALLYKWRANPSTLQASLHDTLPDYETFRRDFGANYFSHPDLSPFFLRNSDGRVAFIRFRPYQGADHRSFIKSAEVSIVVHPEKRRKGFGLEALVHAQDMARQQQVHTLYAQIRPENEISKKLFKKAGYQSLERRTVTVEGLYGRKEVVVDVFSYNVLPLPKEKRVFLVAEIGSNWQIGSQDQRHETAALLVKAASEAGFDAVKFQTFRSESVYAPGAGKSGYLAHHGTDTDINALFRDLEMSYKDLPFLSNLADTYGLEFMATPFSPDVFDAGDPYVSHHKIPLLHRAAASRKPVFLSTGASYPAEIAFAVDELTKAGCRDLTLLQCTASYPAPPASMNVRAMRSLSLAYSLPVGLSDHSVDYCAAPLLAVAYGARVIEKHVTLQRSQPTPDSFFSLEPHEMTLFVEKIRLAEQMVGSAQKSVQNAEEELFCFAKRAIQSLRSIRRGEILQDGYNVAILRPGNNRKGAHPSFYSSVCGKRAVREISMGEGIHLEDVT